MLKIVLPSLNSRRFFQAMQSDADSEITVIDDEESVTNSPQEEKYNKVLYELCEG